MTSASMGGVGPPWRGSGSIAKPKRSRAPATATASGFVALSFELPTISSIFRKSSYRIMAEVRGTKASIRAFRAAMALPGFRIPEELLG